MPPRSRRSRSLRAPPRGSCPSAVPSARPNSQRVNLVASNFLHSRKRPRYDQKKKPHGIAAGLQLDIVLNDLRGRPCGVAGGERLDAHLPLLTLRLVLNHTIDERVNRIVAAETDVAPRMHAGAALTDENIAGLDGLARVNLDTPALARTVAAIARRTLAFFVRHAVSPGMSGLRGRSELKIRQRLSAGGNFLDLEYRQFLPMPAFAAVGLAALFLEHDYLRAARLLQGLRRYRRD